MLNQISDKWEMQPSLLACCYIKSSWRLFSMIEVQKLPRGWCLIELHRWCWCWLCHPLWASPHWPPTRSLLLWVGRFPQPVSSDSCHMQGFLWESRICSEFGWRVLQRRPGRRGSKDCSSGSEWSLRGGRGSRSHPYGTPAMSGCLELWAHSNSHELISDSSSSTSSKVKHNN